MPQKVLFNFNATASAGTPGLRRLDNAFKKLEWAFTGNFFCAKRSLVFTVQSSSVSNFISKACAYKLVSTKAKFCSKEKPQISLQSPGSRSILYEMGQFQSLLNSACVFLGAAHFRKVP